jgi:sec-independent protein translocase protein TatB
MFDIGAIEILVIAVVAILVVGPKDLPGLLRGIGRFTKQARSMIGDMQRQFNDALDEAELGDVRQTFSDMRDLNPRQQMMKGLKKQIEPHKKDMDDIEHSLHHAFDMETPFTNDEIADDQSDQGKAAPGEKDVQPGSEPKPKAKQKKSARKKTQSKS